MIESPSDVPRDGYWHPDDGPITVAEAVRMIGPGSMARVHPARNAAVIDLLQRQAAQVAETEAALVDLYNRACGHEGADMLHCLYPAGSHTSAHYPKVRSALYAAGVEDDQAPVETVDMAGAKIDIDNGVVINGVRCAITDVQYNQDGTATVEWHPPDGETGAADSDPATDEPRKLSFDEWFAQQGYSDAQRALFRGVKTVDARTIIRRIQNGEWDRHTPEPPKGRVAEQLWNDDNFAYGMEYGAIVALMQAFGLSKEDL